MLCTIFFVAPCTTTQLSVNAKFQLSTGPPAQQGKNMKNYFSVSLRHEYLFARPLHVRVLSALHCTGSNPACFARNLSLDGFSCGVSFCVSCTHHFSAKLQIGCRNLSPRPTRPAHLCFNRGIKCAPLPLHASQEDSVAVSLLGRPFLQTDSAV